MEWYRDYIIWSFRMREIELFVPYRFDKRPIYVNYINRMFDHEAIYVSKGRYAITHILKSHGIEKGKIAISSYMCTSVVETLQKKGYTVVYYDVDIRDMNADLISVEQVIENEKPRAIVIASMYGNPANLAEIEKLCKNKGIIMIDDAAQSFGAKVDGRFVGSFGDGGFFSFSPGKPTAAHRGGIFGLLKNTILREPDTSFLH